MKRIIGFYFTILALAGFSFLGLSSCNVAESGDSYILSVKLDDSLAVESNLFDSINIDLFDSSGVMTHADVYKGPYHKSDAAKLAKLVVAKKIPNPVTIRITAFKDTNDYWVFTVKITNDTQERLAPVHTVTTTPVVANPGDTLAPISIVITSPITSVLYLGDPSISLSARAELATATQTVTWSLSSGDAAVLESGNKLKAIKAGTVTLKATSTRPPFVFATMDLTIKEATVVIPESLSLRMATPMILAVEGADGDLLWKVLPTGADTGVDWSSSDTAIAKIIPGNKVRPLKKGTAKITGKSKVKSTVTATFDISVIVPVKVDAISMLPKSMTLYTGGTDSMLTVAMTGNDTGAHYSLSSSDALIASVTATGAVKGRKAGLAVITAAVVGYPTVSSVCSVTVITDLPVVTITPDQNVAYGGEATFFVSVTQAYGTTAEIKSDMDGNGTFEKSVLAKDTSTFKATYTEAKVFNLSFEIKDSEGNVVALTRKVTVTAATVPVVKIIDPATAITVNTTTYTVKFTVKDPTKAVDEAKDSIVTLDNGANTIKVTRTNPGGSGSAQVVITLDNTAPGTPVFMAQPAFTTDDTPTWTWSAVPGAAKYQVRMNDGDFTKPTGTIDVTVLAYTAGVSPDGPYTLYLRSLDNLGNASTYASQLVTVKKSLPATPVLVSAPAAISTVRTLEWKWRSGDATKGNGTYEVWLNDVAQPNVTAASFKTSTAQPDGKYILKVKELDALGQESAAFLTFAQITIDGTKPVISASYADGSVTTLATTTKVTVTGSIFDGLAGSGIQSATYALSGKTTRAPTAITNPEDFNLAAVVLASGGVTTMTISATDMANNTQTYTMGFNVTLKAPDVKIISPNDGYVTSSIGSITVNYTVNGVAATPVTCTIEEPTSTTTSNSKACAVSASNEAGTGSDTRTYFRVNRNVIFFKPTGKLSGTCSDWENACAFVGILDGWNGKTMWVAVGDYNLGGAELSVVNVKIYGGLTEGATTTTVTGTPYSNLIGIQVGSTPNIGIRMSGPTLEVNRLSFTGTFSSAALQNPNDGGVSNFNDCKFYELIAKTPYYGLAIYTHSTTIFTRCIFDNTGGVSSMINFTSPFGEYLSLVSCTFKTAAVDPGPFPTPHYDIDNGQWIEDLPPNSIRITPAGSSNPFISNPQPACGLPGTSACP